MDTPSTKVVPGLYISKEVIAEEQETKLIEYINKQSWNKKLTRWTQHYGYEYDYNTRNVNKKVDKIPNKLIDKFDFEFFEADPDQCIVNRYLPGEGIAAHIDRDVFGDVIASVSLGSDCCFNFTYEEWDILVYVPRRSILYLTGDSRHLWKHEIRKRKTDTYDGVRKSRNIRYSLTFRTTK